MFHPRTTRVDPEDAAHTVDRLRRLLPEPARLLPTPIGARPRRTARSDRPPPAVPDPTDPRGDPPDWPDPDGPPAPPILRADPRSEPGRGSSPPPNEPPDTPIGPTDPNDDIPDVDLTPARLRRGHVVVVSVVLLVAIIGAGVLLLRSRPSAVPVARSSVHATMLATGKPIASSTGVPSGYRRTSQGATFLFVHVAGKVRRPGVVRLPVGARVYDAIKAAGGARAGVDLSTLNLARPLADGEQVLVGVEQPPQSLASLPTQPGVGPYTAQPAEQLDLNTATIEQLDLLPGVGPVLAQRIIEARDQRGGFTAVEELREVNGIGDRKYAELQERVTIQ